MKAPVIALKALLFFLWSLLLVPPQMVVMFFHRGPYAYALPHLWQKGICRIFGLKVLVEGVPETKNQCIFVANHVSYLDIPVMGSVLKASFIAKKEVAGWPVFGFLSRLQQTAFISRSRGDAQREKNTLSNMLDEGKSLILFPEGTSTDGRSVAPFKSSLFSLTLDGSRSGLVIQPVTLKIESVDGKNPESPAVRDIYAWYGDMTMPPHLSGFAKSRGAVIKLIFHPVIKPSDYDDRKGLADTCWAAVRDGLGKDAIAREMAA